MFRRPYSIPGRRSHLDALEFLFKTILQEPIERDGFHWLPGDPSSPKPTPFCWLVGFGILFRFLAASCRFWPLDDGNQLPQCQLFSGGENRERNIYIHI